MRYRGYIPLLLGSLAAISTAGAAHGDVFLANGGFETLTVTTGPLPDGYGYWRGDMSSIVESTNGITPYEGTQMLRFDNSTVRGASAAVGSELWQLIDLSSYRSTVRSGDAHIEASAFFNRVAESLGTQIDTMFSLGVYCYSGDAGTFPSQWGRGELGSNVASLYSDADLQTWEDLNVVFDVPELTDFVAIRVSVTEDGYNDLAGVEYAGHVVDGVGFTIIPTPASLMCLLPAGFMIVGRRRRA